MPFPYLDEIQQLDEKTRSAADGSFIMLPAGTVHYELAGPTEAPVVVLVHGFSVPYFIFDPTFEFLVSAGYRVLRYDLFGRGWSDRPRLANNIHLFVDQLCDLLDTLKIRSPITLTGLSMGGPITAAFTVQHPQRVSRNVFIDPSGVHKLSLGGLSVGLVPGVGELVLGLFGSERLVKNIASDFFDPALVEHFQARYRPQMRFAGFKRSILSTLRSGMLGDFSGVYQALSRLQKPTLIFWGREDTTVPFPHSADLAGILPLAELRVIEGCGHIPHYEKPEQFNPALLSFLQRGA
ncbi:MAG TPA: alpha/beta hydrolase [Anaerolineales bacterium]